ncbi:MAG TPA: metallophosphoesterase family protein [Symbiobacteriaceae bacterium]|nr:metallophosphoesterase family protein [Symbiobacteriaceae bacterium]
MRLAVIGDTHGNLPAFEAVLADLRRQSPDAIVCMGDISFRGPQPAECIELVRSLRPLAVVRGNTDMIVGDEERARQSIKAEEVLAHMQYHNSLVRPEAVQWLTNLPMTERLTLEGLRVDLFHATPWSIAETVRPWAPQESMEKLCIDDSADLVIYGHIHHPFVRWVHGRQVVNPGSVGMPFDGDQRAAYALVDFEAGNLAVQFRRVQYDVESVVQMALDRIPLPDPFVNTLRTAQYCF